jgi:hypothetical protein
MAGNASGYGLLDLGELAKKLEHAAKDRHYDICRDLVGKMKKYLTDLTPKFV